MYCVFVSSVQRIINNNLTIFSKRFQNVIIDVTCVFYGINLLFNNIITIIHVTFCFY